MLRLGFAVAIALGGLQVLRAQSFPARDAGWQSDIDFLLQQLGKQHLVLSRRPLPAPLVQAAARLKDSVRVFSDERMLIELQRLAAFAGDGHTYVLPMGAERAQSTVLPLRFYAFSDGLHVIDAQPGHEQWIGSRVLRFGSLPAEHAMRKVRELISRDNAMGVQWVGPFFLGFRGTLEALTDAVDLRSAELTLHTREGRTTTTRLPFVAPPRMRGIPKLPAPRQSSAPAAPRWLGNVDTPYWFDSLQSGTMFVQFNQVMDAPAEPIEQFATRLAAAIAWQRPRVVIVDVRHNNGGSKELLPPLTRVLREFDQSRPDARLYVLTGRNTFSAAQVFIAQLARDTKAVFAGEASSSRPNFVGEENAVVLPWSGAMASVSNREHISIPGDRRELIPPSLPVALRAADYFGGRDPVLEAVLRDSRSRNLAPEPDLAITNVTVVEPGPGARSLTGQTILIRGGMIETVGPSPTTPVPRGIRRVDARGKYAIPGLWDMHVHFMNTGVSALPLLVAHGVTTVREMGGFIDSTRAWQARMRAGALTGPRILTAGPILESPRYLQGVRDRSVRDPRLAQRVLPYRISVGGEDDARRAIDSLVALGVDFVKVRTTASPQAYYAILREARRARLTVTGHQPTAVSLGAALDSGQSDISHALFPILARLPPGARDSIYRRFLAARAWYTPTLVVSRAASLPGDSADRAIFSAEARRGDPRRAFASPWLLEWWQMQVDERKLDTGTARWAEVREGYRSSVADVRRMQELGVPILAGTDAGSVLVYPGISLHEELQLLVEDAGLSPAQALWSATLGPAQFTGRADSLGLIAVGKTADLVLLDANPIANIRNTRRIAAVVKGGHLLDRRALDVMLRTVRSGEVPSSGSRDGPTAPTVSPARQ
ncbi:MAG: amidohydrolase family protein [Gemmatimonadaceae bacterium]